MAWSRAIVYSVLSARLWSPTNAEYIWPNEDIDEVEKILFEGDNPFDGPGSGFASILGDCHGLIGTPSDPLGRSLGAEWLRNSYHDMATANVHTGTGGLDASIVFEMDRAENVGQAFQETFDTFKGARNSRASMADLFAIATVMALGDCSDGKVIIPFRGGRVDAVGPGPSGVPEPQQDLATHTESFANQGFNVTEMIALVACGHSIGGVHGVDFPTIVPNPPDSGTDNTVTFDTTTDNFDNFVLANLKILHISAKEFVANVSQNPLAFGQNETTRSDFRIFNADGGDLISQMAASQDFFLSTCTTMLERMLNTVPRSVKLTDVIKPASVKPRKLFLTVNADGTLFVNGIIRITDTVLGSSGSQVTIHPVSRLGKPLPIAIGTTKRGFTGGCGFTNCGPDYTYYEFNTTVSAKDGISSFTVETKDSSTGKVTTYSNGGAGFPFSDDIQPIISQSNQTIITIDGTDHLQLNITAAVLNAEQFTDISLIVPQPSNVTAPISPWVQDRVSLKPSHKIQGTSFTIYTGTWQSNSAAISHPFDVVATGPTRTVSSLFNSWQDIPFV
ncbi:wsc domain-containing [Trichoderma arundinaceum]|uniref:Peroxidase n=1 Tax=Trichoderma arundinaceum TaxID=490622 RepID=A0A395NH09_TRIAR|nr:wsc domain-containing [Trichoderma arundinaceum]